jgi:hypothetical protein
LTRGEFPDVPCFRASSGPWESGVDLGGGAGFPEWFEHLKDGEKSRSPSVAVASETDIENRGRSADQTDPETASVKVRG